MKNRRALLILFVPLAFVFAVESAATPPPVSVESASEEFFCSLSQIPVVEVPGATPDPTPAVEVCGTCGQDLCDNRNVGAVCYDTLQAKFGWCIPPWGGSCSDGRPNCQCATDYQ